MKVVPYCLALVLSLVFMGSASARPHYYHRVYSSEHYSGGRDYRDCALAARLGGPCGCIAMKHVGITNIRFWRVTSWYSFPATSPHPGAAALWGHRHVEIVTAVNGNTVTTDGPYGIRVTKIAYLHFVEPNNHVMAVHPSQVAVWHGHRNRRYEQQDAYFAGGRWPAI